MKNMVEVVMDDDKILADGRYSLESIHEAIDEVFVNRHGLVKEGNFYVDEDPSDSYGAGMSCMLFLCGKPWFRDNVKVLRWHKDIHHYGQGLTYHVEDVKKDVLKDWDETCRRRGVPIDR